MDEYLVTIVMGASQVIAVEAESVDEAIETAYGAAEYGLCHHCAKKFDLGDIDGAVVVLGGEEVADTTSITELLSRLKAENDALRSRILELEKRHD